MCKRINQKTRPWQGKAAFLQQLQTFSAVKDQADAALQIYNAFERDL
jgi:hypothetical protein